MSQFDEAQELIEHAKGKMVAIKQTYEESLNQKSIKPVLLIEIKNFMENLRSALDFVARGLYSKYGSSGKADPNIYFPYANKNQSLASFRKSKRIEQCILGLTTSRPDIAAVIEDMQHWNPDYAWLPKFMDLNNQNKHERLTPQTRKESKELRITSGGTSISVGEGASIQLGQGTSIQMGDAIIPGGQTIDVNNPPTVFGEGRSEIITWVSFRFEANDQLVLPFLRQALDGVGQIVDDLSSM